MGSTVDALIRGGSARRVKLGIGARSWPTSLRTKSRAEGADVAGHDPQGNVLQANSVRCVRQIPPGAGTTMPPYHRPSAGQRTRANQNSRSGGALAQDSMARRRHPLGDVAAGVHAATGCRAAAAPAKDCFAAVNLTHWMPGLGRQHSATTGCCRESELHWPLSGDEFVERTVAWRPKPVRRDSPKRSDAQLLVSRVSLLRSSRS